MVVRWWEDDAGSSSGSSALELAADTCRGGTDDTTGGGDERGWSGCALERGDDWVTESPVDNKSEERDGNVNTTESAPDAADCGTSESTAYTGLWAAAGSGETSDNCVVDVGVNNPTEPPLPRLLRLAGLIKLCSPSFVSMESSRRR